MANRSRLGKKSEFHAGKKAKKPVTIADILAFIKESREVYKDGPTVADVWETGSTHDIAEASNTEGKLELLDELEDYLKRGN